MEFQSLSYTIDTIIQRIRTSRLALPDFQREFVWNPSRVVELLDSVARQWPIGSLLLLSGPQPFAIRPIDSGPSISDKELDLYILDGQQRITSLYHAISDVSDFCYYIDFDLLSKDDDDYICWERRERFNKTYPKAEDRARHNIALIKEVWNLEQFYSWIELLEDGNKKFEYVRLRDKKLRGLQAQVYKVMAIQLDQEINLEALARIFETLNRTGVRLNAFDLMVAALYPSGFHLRDEWESAIDRNQILQQLKPEAIEILKLASLIIRSCEGKQASAGVRQGDLLKIERSKIRKTWPQALSLYTESLQYCKDHFGAICEEAIPSWSMVLGVAAWLNKKERNEKLIELWWNNRLITQHFNQAANTRIVSDFELISSSEDDFTLQAPPLEIFGEPAKRNGLLTRGLAGALIKNGAIDPLSGTALKHEKKVLLRSLTPEGIIRRPTATDPISSILIVSEETDRKIGKEIRALELSPIAKSALISQGFSPQDFSRNISFMEEIFKVKAQGKTNEQN